MSLNNRYDFVFLFDVRDGNPNGDPDMGNLPRMDIKTRQGLVTDVAIKRKVRNYVDMVKGNSPGYEIFVKEKSVLNWQIERAYTDSPDVQAALEAYEAWKKNKKKYPMPSRHYEDVARDWMCKHFYDVRTFGAVMSTGSAGNGDADDPEDAKNEKQESSKLRKVAGQVRGPVQIVFARSVGPIEVQEHSITRMAVTNEKNIEKKQTMGRKSTIPYALYVAHGFVSSFLAKQTGFSEEDLQLLWQAMQQMFEHDRSAARGEMNTRGLYVFKHDSELGNAPAHALFERIQPRLKEGVTAPRAFSDYEVVVDEANMPSGVTLMSMV